MAAFAAVACSVCQSHDSMVSYEELLTLPTLEAGTPGMSTAPSPHNSNPQCSGLQGGGGAMAGVVGWGGQHGKEVTFM